MKTHSKKIRTIESAKINENVPIPIPEGVINKFINTKISISDNCQAYDHIPKIIINDNFYMNLGYRPNEVSVKKYCEFLEHEAW